MRKEIFSGKLLIINQEKNLAKILLANGDETKVIKVPQNYESGDIIRFHMVNIGRRSNINIISAKSPHKYFGIILFNKERQRITQSIIGSYPTPIGLLRFSKNELNLAYLVENRQVEFEVYKEKSGYNTAVNLNSPKPSDLYKCFSPKHAFVKKAQPVLGYVSHIDRNFVELEVNEKRYKIIASILRKTHKAPVKIGDIISCQLHNGVIKILSEEIKDLYQVFLTNNQKDAPLAEGVIKNYFHNKNMGYVEAYGTKYYFRFNTYLRSYHETPSIGKKVRFIRPHEMVNRNNPHLCPTIRSFEPIPIPADSSTFKDFMNPQGDELFRVYLTSDSFVREIQRSKPDKLSYALAIIKDNKMPQKNKLPALNTIVQHKFSDKKISTEDFQNQYMLTLQNLINEHISKQEFTAALQYEYIFQNIIYDPSRLKAYSKLAKWINPISFNGDIQNVKSRSKTWNIMEEKIAPKAAPSRSQKTWQIDLSPLKDDLDKYHHPQKWHIMLDDITTKPIIKNTYKSYYNIDARGNNERDN